MNGFRTFRAKKIICSYCFLLFSLIPLASHSLQSSSTVSTSNPVQQPYLEPGGILYADMDTANQRLFVVMDDGLWQYDIKKENWKFLDSLKSISNKLDELEFGYNATYKTLQFWDRGVGSVYELNLNNYNIEQIDHSHPHKNQYGHQPFFRDGILYAFGGYGYWKWKNYLTLFNRKLNEWNIHNVNPASPIPDARTPGTGIYISSTKEFFLHGGGAPASEQRADDQYTERISKNDLWKFSFTNNMWKSIDELDRDYTFYNSSKLVRLGKINRLSSSIYSEKSKFWYVPLIHKNRGYSMLYLAPVNILSGEALQPIELTFGDSKQFHPATFFFNQKTQHLVMLGFDNLSEAERYPLRITQVPEDSLLKKIEHSSLPLQTEHYYYLGGFIFIGVILVFVYWKRMSSPFISSASLPLSKYELKECDWLNNQEKQLAQELFNADGYLESSNLEELVWPGIDNYDYRRKLRNETINAINRKFQDEFNSRHDIIDRMKDPEDNRRNLYGLNSEVVQSET